MRFTGNEFSGIVNIGGEVTMEGCVVGPNATIVVVDDTDDDTDDE